MDTTNEAAIARLEELLQDTYELAEENNKILMSLQRTARWAFWGKALLWVVVLILPFIFLGPLLKALVPATGGSGTGTNLFVPSPEQIKGLLQQYQDTNSGS